ncbi:hypothetical protein E4P40_25475 [Blastococcus sp. CT_GayMR20]|uniref:hypothetical protein n=1 Tax=Blastococcus sp. CT_GayMR20 TaxID=2559609 RepID=UPI0010743450|nr:hypothetical protein [Blastococcus sp. CT_GayMR20]TFV66311.1 hypothetical protein E4P40_25475 [Blastococcus sp. CT_GayMR20]
MWVDRPVGDPGRPGAERVRLRLVHLWGREVAVDEHRRVWCSGCWQLIPVEELGRLDNSHPPGLPNRSGGRLMPFEDGGRSEPVQSWPGGF